MQELPASKPQRIVTRVFLALYALVFSVLLFGLLKDTSVYQLRWYALLPLLLAFLAAVYAFSYFLNGYLQKISRIARFVSLGVCVFLFTCNVITGFSLRFEPLYDLEAIYQGAIAWVETGSFTNAVFPSADPNYFYMFPNNLGGLTLLAGFFKAASLFGVHDYFAVALLCNSALIALTVYVSATVARMLYGAAAELTVLLFFLLCPPFYFMGAVFYTDSLSMLFPVLAFFLYLHALRAETPARKALFGALCGLALAIGMFIKFSVVIAGIAMVVHFLSTVNMRKWLRNILVFCCMAGVIAGCFLLRSAYFYPRHLRREKADEIQIPYSHWVMMGLKGNGGYNPEDYEYTRSFPTLTERDAAARSEIARRVSAYGFSGLVSHCYTKGLVVYGDATCSLSEYLDDNPVNLSALHVFLLGDGLKHSAYRRLCTVFRLGLLLLALIAALRALFSRNSRLCTLPHICLFGFFLFMCLWETSGRYVINFLPMLMLAALPVYATPAGEGTASGREGAASGREGTASGGEGTASGGKLS
ncbi:glycosyltransferase family 39 protein [Christensenellaceae bacterium OttesenSCG-928-L17]|nr:glycosyltransferase family 39 protein [Christensenellaceae bacterium OttesenSCG-928-L17]